jgi:Fe-S oxidoreductase
MCPSYHATRDEEHSTRGRANLFRQLFSGKQADAFTDDDLQDALSLCLSCKACKSECPANVDMAKMKAEYLHGRHQNKGLRLSERFFGQADKFYPLAAIFPFLTNKISKTNLFKRLLSAFTGVDSRRNLPQFANKPFRKWFSVHKKEFQKGRKQVALLIDPFTNYHDPKVAIAACRVFDKLGFDIVLPDVKATGRPQISKGLLDKAKTLCEKNLDLLLPFVEKGIPIIGLEPSELLTLRDEYTDLCNDGRFEDATRIAKNSFLFEEFISGFLEESDTSFFNGNGNKVYLHGHCHTKALVGNDPLIKMLKLAGLEPEDLETGCCGMAGSFGYEHYDVSMKVGEQVLFPKVRELPEDSLICAPGFSCKHQVSDALERQTLHPAEILKSGMELITDQPV